MANVFDTAKYILEKKGRLSTMKLQKLFYYAQSWSLVWDGAPLFLEDFEAWANGPICRVLFEYSKGNFSVDADEMQGNSGKLMEEQKNTVNEVLKYYGGKDAQWLSRLMHMEDPWQKARVGVHSEAVCENIITKESMAIYYGGL